jgi:hypothetical protein
MNTGHGNHWECLKKPVDEAIASFISAAVDRGRAGKAVRRKGLWFNRGHPTEEGVFSLLLGDHDLGVMVLVVTDSQENVNSLYTAYPCAWKGARQHLRLKEIRDWGNEVEAVLVGENSDGIEIAFFDTRYFANRDRYQVGESYDFRIAGLIYSARCTNDETTEITDQERIAQFHKGMSSEPERSPDGTLAPIVIEYAGCTGYAGASEAYPEDAEFYCVIGKVAEFDFEGVRVFQITPKPGDKTVPLPGLIFGAALMFKEGYVPKQGDSIGGGLWTQGFLEEPKAKLPAKGKQGHG